MEIEKNIVDDQNSKQQDVKSNSLKSDDSQNDIIQHLNQDIENHQLQSYHDIELKLVFYTQYISIFNEKEEQERKKKLLHILNVQRQMQELMQINQESNLKKDNNLQSLQNKSLNTEKLTKNRIEIKTQDHSRSDF
jgi:hypothetical protein